MIMINRKFADDGVRTTDLRGRKWPLCQLSHNHSIESTWKNFLKLENLSKIVFGIFCQKIDRHL